MEYNKTKSRVKQEPDEISPIVDQNIPILLVNDRLGRGTFVEVKEEANKEDYQTVLPLHMQIKEESREIEDNFVDLGEHYLQRLISLHSNLEDVYVSNENERSAHGQTTAPGGSRYDLNVARSIKRELFHCGECHFSSKYKNIFNRHVRNAHINTSGYVCEYCKSEFTLKCTLARHIAAKHDKVKRFQCAECDMKFARKSAIKTHADSVHRRLRLHKCLECGKKFARKYAMLQHYEVVHKNIKRYKCSECDQTFTQNGSLVNHVKVIHNKEKRYECFKCGLKFGYKLVLNRHVLGVHSS